MLSNPVESMRIAARSMAMCPITVGDYSAVTPKGDEIVRYSGKCYGRRRPQDEE